VDAGALEGPQGRFAVKVPSYKFSFEAEIVAPRGMLPAVHAGLKWLGLISAGGIAIVLAFVVIAIRRTPGNPVADMERALAAGEFVPDYQPIVDIRSGQLRGASWCAGARRTARWCYPAPSSRWRNRAG
jgi:sensor c-di-GMP phosphodiesterase-like protein